MQSSFSQRSPRFPYGQAQQVLCAALQRFVSPQQAKTLADTSFGSALVTTLAVCARAGMGEQELQRLAEQQADQHVVRLRSRGLAGLVTQPFVEA